MAVASNSDFFTAYAGEEHDYQITGYFPDAHKHNAFAVLVKSHSRRRLIERVNIAFPLRFSSKTGIHASSGSRPAKRGLMEVPASLRSPLVAAVARSGAGNGRKAI